MPASVATPHHVVALADVVEDMRDVLGWVLEIGIQGHDDLPPGVIHAGEHGGVLAIVPVELDRAYPHRPN